MSTDLIFSYNAKLFLMGCILTCITNLFSAFTHTSINTAVDGVEDFLKESYRQRGTSLSDAQISLIRGIYNSVYYAGQVLGAVLGPHLPDKYGRKKAYIVTTIMMTISSVIQGVATLTIYPEIMILGRFVGAFFAPMNDTVMLLYCQETSTPKMRGVLNSLFSFGYSTMGLIGMIVGMKTILGNHLTMLLMIPVPFGLIGSFYLFYLKETPKWLAIARFCVITICGSSVVAPVINIRYLQKKLRIITNIQWNPRQ